MPIIRSPSNCRCSLWFPYECGGGSVLSRGRPWLRTRPPPDSYGNQRLQRQFDELLIMGIIMPETCWAVSVRQSNKILRLIVASSWVFYLSDWRCTEPQTLDSIYVADVSTPVLFTGGHSLPHCDDLHKWNKLWYKPLCMKVDVDFRLEYKSILFTYIISKGWGTSISFGS